MSTLYKRRILNDPEVRLSYVDPLIGIVRGDDLTLELSNTDGYFDTSDLRGERLDFGRFEKGTKEQLTELSGVVIDQTLLLDRVRLRVMSQDIEDLHTLIPKRLVTTTLFPKAHPQTGLNRVIPIVLGQASGFYELPFVGDDNTTGQYDYLVGDGTFSNVAIYRDTVGDTLGIVTPTEYTINTTAYPGVTVIRFPVRQTQRSGGLHRLFASVDGQATERNFVKAVQAMLSTTTWGLGKTVDTAVFTAEAAKLDAIGSLYCDGVLNVQRPAIDYLNQLLIVRGMRLWKTNAGVWATSVDQDQSTVRVNFGHGKGEQWANVQQFGNVRRTPVSEAIKTLYLDYHLDRLAQRYILSSSARSVLTIGKERRIEHDFIRNPTTGDKVADYLAKKLLAGDVSIDFEAGQEARRLLPGDLIRYTSMRPVFTTVFQVQGLRRVTKSTTIEARAWDTTPFTYTPGTLPTAPALPTDLDFSNTVPTAVSSLTLASSGTEADGQGGFTAYVVLQYTVPDETFAQTFVRRRKNGTMPWETVAMNQETGAAKQTRITGLITGMAYDYQVSRVNILNPALSADVSLLNQVAPGDITAPSAPSAIAVRQGTGKVVEIDLTFTEPADWGTTELYRHTSNDSSTATLIDTKKAKRFHDSNVAFGTIYYYWAKVVDFTGNKSGFSPSSSHSITPVQVQATEIADAAIVNAKIGTAAVASANIQDAAIVNAKIGNLAVDTLQIAGVAVTTAKRQLMNTVSVNAGAIAPGETFATTITHNLGVKPTVVAMITASDLHELRITLNTTSPTTAFVLRIKNQHASLTDTVQADVFYW